MVDVSAACSNITARLLEGLHLPQGVERLIFKTDNTIKCVAEGQGMASRIAEWGNKPCMVPPHCVAA